MNPLSPFSEEVVTSKPSLVAYFTTETLRSVLFFDDMYHPPLIVSVQTAGLKPNFQLSEVGNLKLKSKSRKLEVELLTAYESCNFLLTAYEIEILEVPTSSLRKLEVEIQLPEVGS